MKLTLLNLDAARRAEQERRVSLENDAPVKAALSPSLFGLGAPDDETGFRRIGGRNSLRELNPAMQRRMQDICFFVATATPWGEGIIRVMTDYVVGEGFKPVADHPDLQAYLDAFWNDPVNRMDENLPRHWRELLIFGEQCLPVVENPVDGFVRIGSVDPMDVEAVEFGRLITKTPMQPLSLPTSVKLVDTPELHGARMRIAQTASVLVESGARTYDGDCFYFSINQVKSASRGLSELFVLADWVDLFDQMIFDFGERVNFLNSFVWEYILKGADDKTVEKYNEYVRKHPPKKAGYQVHNDSVEMKTLTPDFKGADMSEVAKMMKAYGPGAKSLPPWFFGDPMDANRAANEVMEGPAGKMLGNKQLFLKRAIHQIGDYAIRRAKARRTLLPSLPEGWQVQAPDMSGKDMQKAAGTLQTAGSALSLAEDRGWIRSETAARTFHNVLTQLGTEVKETEFKLAQDEKQERDAEQINDLNDQAELAEKLKATRTPEQVM